MNAKINVRYKLGECPYWILYITRAQHDHWTWMQWAHKHILQTSVYDVNLSKH